jgi:hypothetical protein
MSDTENLALPCIEGPEAEFHVTHNEALRVLDTLVQLAVLDRDLAAPPASPDEGARWIVGASPSGAWSAHANHVAAWQDGAWQFSAPRAGWIAYAVDEDTLVVWNGSAWVDFLSTITALQNLARLGVGTTADATNPFSAKLNNALWVARTVAEGGDGNLRCKLSKETAGGTLSLLFQTNFSGRAEAGLAGDDDFHFKVSPDGSAWFEAITIDRNTGKLAFPASGGPRETLTADRTYYVRTDGNDANSGLADTAGGAFRTIQKAVDVVASLDLSTRQVTIQLADGTYTAPVALKRCLGALAPIIQGNGGTPANVVIATSGVSAITNDNGGLWIVRDLKVSASTVGNCLHALNFGSIYFANLDFGACPGYHLYSQANATIKATGGYKVSGGAQYHVAANGWVVLSGQTITYANSPNFSGANFLAGRAGVVECFGMTFVNGGMVTGVRYVSLHNGVIYTAGAGAAYIPGSVAGSDDGYGMYG